MSIKSFSTKIRLGQLLLKNNKITDEQLNKALKIQKETDLKLGEILVNQNFIKEEELKEFLSMQKINFFFI